jgi:uncharacterized alpha-E superfamily protein
LQRGGVRDTFRCLHDLARIVRDRISTDTWRVLSLLNEGNAWPARLNTATAAELVEHLNSVLITLSSFGGLASESMTRGQFWRFMDMGRRIERTTQVAGLLSSTLVHTGPGRNEGPLLEAILEIADSVMTYRRRYMANLQLAPVLDLLLADETNPRSAAFQVAMLEEHAGNLLRDPNLAGVTPEQRIIIGLSARLKLLRVGELCEPGENGRREQLAELLGLLETETLALSDVLTRGYLSHAETSKQLASFRGEGAR